MEYKFIDLFAGIGGFRKGFEDAGFKCVFTSEINPQCQQVYKNNFGEQPFGDITKIEPENIPNFDVLLAGFPFQPFSISGKKWDLKILWESYFSIFVELSKKNSLKSLF